MRGTTVEMSGQSAERQPIYDSWRGVAVLCVLVGHYFWNPGINVGRFGVELFFVLSGTLMAKLLFDERQPLLDFAVRRFSRIYPMLAVFIAVVAALAIALPQLGALTYLDIVSGLTFTFNNVHASADAGASIGPIAHIWSVCVEAHSYLILGAIAFAHRRWRVPVLPTILIIAGLMMAYGVVLHLASPQYYGVYWRTEVRAASVLIGAACYLSVARIPERIGSWTFAALPILLASFIFQTDPVPDPIKYTVGTTLAALSLTLLARQHGGLLSKLASAPPLVFLGTISYSLYLWQFPLLYFGGNRIVLAGVALLLSCLSCWLVEKPARRALNRLLSPRGRFETAQARSERAIQPAE